MKKYKATLWATLKAMIVAAIILWFGFWFYSFIPPDVATDTWSNFKTGFTLITPFSLDLGGYESYDTVNQGNPMVLTGVLCGIIFDTCLLSVIAIYILSFFDC